MATFEDISILGDGGFGEVWECRRDTDNKKFAKKRLVTSDPEAIARFSREVRLLSSLDHPNVVKVIAKRLNSPPYFYIMPIYRCSLESQIRNVAGDFDRIDTIFSQILDGIEYSHAQGVVHRDLKSANILLNDDSEVVISDFGLGRRFDATTTRQTNTGYGLGTFLYMPPEQVFDARNADERSDIFSLGRLLTEMWLGNLSVAQDLSSIPAGIRRIIDKCTKANPNDRYQNIAQIKTAWTQYKQIRAESDSARSLRKLLAKAQNGSLSGEAAVRSLFEQLEEQSDDFIHDAVMGIDVSTLAEADADTIDIARRILLRFAEFTREQSYGFDYTDKIATVCLRFAVALKEPIVAAHLAACCGFVGLNHNRWFVIETFAKLANNITGSDFINELVNLLQPLRPEQRQRLSRYVDMAKVHPALKVVLGG